MMNENFGIRLKSARRMRGLSMEQLVERMNGCVTKQAICKYENGKMMPGSEVLVALSRALELPVDYFFREGVQIAPFSFRTDSRISAQTNHQLESISRDWIERYLTLEDLLSIVSSFKNPVKHKVISSYDDVERAAGELRRTWNMGDAPIQSVYGMLEFQGVKIIELSVDAPGILGFATTVADGIPLIVVNTMNHATTERKRFTVLHELAHLLLQFPEGTEARLCERYCERFAGAVLCPPTVMRGELGEKRQALTLDELIHLREYCGMSIAAIVHRAKDLGIISEVYYNHIFDDYIHANPLEEGWGSFPFAERTTRFERLLQRAALEGTITLSRAAELANLKLGDYRDTMKQNVL